MADLEKEQTCSNTEEKSEKPFWYFDLIEAKSEQLKPMLNSVLKPELKDRLLLGAQSFTSLMVDLCQDINRVSSFGRWLNGIFP